MGNDTRLRELILIVFMIHTVLAKQELLKSASYTNNQLTNVQFYNGRIYLTDQGNIYEVNENLETLASAVTCEDKTVECTSVNKILLVNKATDELIMCGTGNEGNCELRNLSNINLITRISSGDYILKVSSDPNRPAQAVLMPNGHMMIGVTFGNGLDEQQASIQKNALTYDYAISSRSLAFQAPKQKLYILVVPKTMEGPKEIPIEKQVKSLNDYAIYFKKGFQQNGFSYFLTNQKQIVGESNYVSRLIRICQNDPSNNYNSYADIELFCQSDGTTYNLIQDAIIIDPPYNTSTSTADTIFVATFTAGNNPESVSGGSAICVTRLSYLDTAIMEAKKAFVVCPGSNYTATQRYLSNNIIKCINESRYDREFVTCGTAVETFKYVIGETPCSMTAAYTLPSDKGYITKLYGSVVDGDKVDIHAGTSKGNIMKMNFLGINKPLELYEEQHVPPGFSVREIYQKGDNYYVMTSGKLLKYNNTNCSEYTTCGDTMAGRNPQCGWCVYEQRSTRKSECSSEENHWLSSLGQCVSLSLDPEGIPINTGGRQVQVTVGNYPVVQGGDVYKCKYKNGAADIGAEEVAVLANNTFHCSCPNVQSLTEATLDLWVNDIMLAQSPFLFYDCGHYKKCGECTCTVGSDCEWCLENTQCVSPGQCSSGSDGNITETNQCPQLLNNSGIYFIPNGVETNIIYNAQNLPTESSARYFCTIPDINNFQPVETSATNATLLTFKLKINIPADVRMKSYPVIIKYGTQQNQDVSTSVELDDDISSSVTVYNCDKLAPDCGRCKALNTTRYTCNWCDTGVCGYSGSQCNTTDTCPAPVITKIVPMDGPRQGGTRVTISGTNLGSDKSDINNVTLVNTLCTNIKVVLDPDSSDFERQMTKEIRCEAGEQTNTSAIGIPGDVIVTVGGKQFSSSLNVKYTYHQLMKYQNTNCSEYTTCADTMTGRNPLCGWCVYEQRSTLKSKCSIEANHWLSSLGQCISLSLNPEGKPINAGNEQVQLTVGNYPIKQNGDVYKCRYKNGAVDISLEEITTSDSGNLFVCNSPNVHSHTEAILELWLNDIMLASTPFLFFDCGHYKRCIECTSTIGSDCEWCLQNTQCVSPGQCNSGAGGNITKMHQCPQLLDNSGLHFIPTGEETDAIFHAKNIPTEINARFFCTIPDIANFEPVEASAKTVTSVTFKLKINISADVRINSYFVYIKYGTQQHQDDNTRVELDDAFSSSVTVYNCERLTTDCGRCKALNMTRYKCDWCDTGVCGYNGSECRPADTCPAPVITKVVPMDGPSQGGTRVTISGTNLGSDKSDINQVTLAYTSCTVTEVVLDPNSPDFKRQVTNEIICEAAKQTNTSAIGVPRDVIVTVAGKQSSSSSNVKFTYQNLTITGMYPNSGPAAGGTRVTISGEHLGAGNRQISIVFGTTLIQNAEVLPKLDFETNVKSVNLTVQFIVPSNILSNITTVRLMAHNNIVANKKLNYSILPNPVIDPISLRKAIRSGGIPITITGSRLTNANVVTVTVEYAGDTSKSVCDIESAIKVICPSPKAPTNLEIQRRKKSSAECGCDCECVITTGKISLDAVEDSFTLAYYKDPTLNRIGDEFLFESTDHKLTIEGNNLNLVATKDDIEVLVGIETCIVIELTETNMTCIAPKDQPQSGMGKTLPEVNVTIGNIHKTLGYLKYKQLEVTNLTIIIVVVVVVVLVIIVAGTLVGYLLYRKMGSKVKELEQKSNEKEMTLTLIESRLKEAEARNQELLNESGVTNNSYACTEDTEIHDTYEDIDIDQEEDTPNTYTDLDSATRGSGYLQTDDMSRGSDYLHPMFNSRKSDEWQPEDEMSTDYLHPMFNSRNSDEGQPKDEMSSSGYLQMQCNTVDSGYEQPQPRPIFPGSKQPQDKSRNSGYEEPCSPLTNFND